MKYIPTILVLMFAFLFLFASGCNTTEDIVAPEPEEVESQEKLEGHASELIDKRGQTTNITELDALKVRASKIDSFKYTFVDSDNQYDYTIYGKGRFFRIILPKTLQHDSGALFDVVYLDRRTKTALSRCLFACAVRDIELEPVDYDHFYRTDPVEYASGLFDAEYIGTEMIGNDFVKVFSVEYLGTPATAYIQEYWGYPIKIELEKEDGSTRTLEFQNMTIYDTRTGEIQIPFNCTVKGEKGNWWFWEHYLGEWPRDKTQSQLPVVQPEYSV